MAELEIKNLSKSYHSSQRIFENFTIHFDDGEFVVILGPSGCGKSTLLRVIAGLEEIDQGEIYLDGKEISRQDPKDRGMSMVFQNYALYPHKTVYGNLEFGLKMRKISKPERKKRIEWAAHMTGLTEFLKRKPKHLSGGQRQRVALGRAIVNQPKILLMDEPLSNLDAKLRLKMRSEIIQLHKELDQTIIYVTHDQVEAMTMADRILLLNEGRLQQFDTPGNLYHQPQNLFTAQFIGTPPMNIFSLGVRDARVRLGDCQFDVPDSYHLDQIYLGVRAEDISLVPDGPYQVLYSENLGNEILIYLKGETHDLVVRSDQEPDQTTYQIQLNQNKLHWFDSQTQLRVEETR